MKKYLLDPEKIMAWKIKTKKYKSGPKGKSFLANYRLKDINKGNARKAVNHAIESGMIEAISTKKCLNCQAVASHYHHHFGYEKENWLKIIPLCIPCHKKVHLEGIIL